MKTLIMIVGRLRIPVLIVTGENTIKLPEARQPSRLLSIHYLRFTIYHFTSRQRFTHVCDSAINNDMSTRELIIKEIENLPEPLQREVYDFARFLHMKADGEL